MATDEDRIETKIARYRRYGWVPDGSEKLWDAVIGAMGSLTDAVKAKQKLKDSGVADHVPLLAPRWAVGEARLLPNPEAALLDLMTLSYELVRHFPVAAGNQAVADAVRKLILGRWEDASREERDAMRMVATNAGISGLTDLPDWQA